MLKFPILFSPFAKDIINNSWHRTVQYYDEVPLNIQQNMFKDAQRQIFRSGVINVCARGNTGNDNTYFPHFAEREDWVISVGGNNEAGFKHSNSSYGGGVDIIAPHSAELVHSLQNYTTSAYEEFPGTSASAPHVTGLAALMLSHIDDQPTTPNNLAPDDVEFLIQRYATDVVSAPGNFGYSIGYDELSGWGKLNAGAVMEKIDRDQYIVKHIKAITNVPTDLSTVPQASGSFFYDDEQMPYGNYQGTLYEVPFIFTNNLNPGDVILNYWPLKSYTNLRDTEISPFPVNAAFSEHGCFIESMNNVYGDVRGTIFHLTQAPNGSAIDYWYPAGPGGVVKVGYTLHIQKGLAELNENDDPMLNVNCFPNPSSNNVTVNFVLTENSDVELEVVDINGRVVRKNEAVNFPLGEQSIDIQSNQWTSGMYFINLKINEKVKTIKYIKQ